MASASDTKLLLHCNGTDGSTSFPDSSQSGHTVTANGTAQVDTAQKKWGTGACLLDGNSDYLSIPDHANWDINAANVTIDLWIKHAGPTLVENYIQQREDASNKWDFFHFIGNGIRFRIISGGTIIVDTGYVAEITDTNWHHVALCKVGNEYGLYKDGTQIGHTSDADTDTFAGQLNIGCSAATNAFFAGHIDEIRIVHGNPFGAAPVAGLTDTITKPTTPHIAWPHKIIGIQNPAKVSGIDANTVGKINSIS